jgi:hypothetical protein
MDGNHCQTIDPTKCHVWTWPITLGHVVQNLVEKVTFVFASRLPLMVMACVRVVCPILRTNLLVHCASFTYNEMY